MPQPADGFFYNNRSLHDDVCQFFGALGGGGYFIDEHGIRGGMNIVHDIVHRMGQQGDIFAVERRHKGAVQQRYYLVGEGIAFVFQFGYFRNVAIQELPGIHHFLKVPGAFDDIGRGAFKKIEEFLFFR